MSEMFDNYPSKEGYIPNNRPKCKHPFRLDIMLGETSKHTFDVPFNVSELCENIQIIYEQGLTPVLVKELSECELVELPHGFTAVTCALSSEETSKFDRTLLDTHVQIKFYMKDGSISFTEVYPVTILDSLANQEQPIPPYPPKPGTLGGIGYTED